MATMKRNMRLIAMLDDGEDAGVRITQDIVPQKVRRKPRLMWASVGSRMQKSLRMSFVPAA